MRITAETLALRLGVILLLTGSIFIGAAMAHKPLNALWTGGGVLAGGGIHLLLAASRRSKT